MPKAMSTRDLWLRTLERAEITTADIQLMLDQHVREDHWLDWKSGKLFNDHKHAGRKLRRQCAGFMNADGGVVVIGANGGDVDDSDDDGEPKWTLSPWPPKVEQGRETLEDRVANMLQTVDPPPRHPPSIHRTVEGDVLLVAVQRAPGLVRVFEKDIPKYFMRFDHTTHHTHAAAESLAMPESLVADVMLGRRARPALDVEAFHVRMSRGCTPLLRDYRFGVHKFQLNLRIVNTSLIPAIETTAIMVHPARDKSAPDYLSRHCTFKGGCSVTQRPLQTIPGLGAIDVEFDDLDILMFRGDGVQAVWKATMIITSASAIPLFVQIQWVGDAWLPGAGQVDWGETPRPVVESYVNLPGAVTWLP